MKILAFILSLYFLGLNLVPVDCADDEEGQQQTEISLQGEDGPSSALELCAPFCSCHCCHVHVTEFDIRNFSWIIQEIPVLDYAYIDPSLQDIYTPLFQPPKI